MKKTVVMELHKEAFENAICDIDSKLAAESTPISLRPMLAIVSIFQLHQVAGRIAHPFKPNLCFPVTEMNLSDHVNKWYSEKYGNKLKIDPSPAQFPLMIEGAVYQCRIPLIYGSFTVLAAKERFSDNRVLNAVDHITDLPQHVRERLSGEFESQILAMFETCYEVTNKLKHRKSDLIKSASSDIHVSCELLCGYKTNSSLSAWHSLQFAEKCLKEFISQFEPPRLIHDVKELVKTAKKFGYVPDTRLNFGLFDFGPSVRYSPEHFQLEQAVFINHESWRVAFNVLKQAK
ncbi:MAG: hypothetical protein KKH12_12975 [Gammaproteobacteria bacterium]|nr:hypothetical protein [Gammaproteobacteria bacterium]MBU1482569.1 hypothetical protein [Gammaproteobacteria bacterium]